MSSISVGLKAVLDMAQAKGDLDAFRLEEGRKGITQKLQVDSGDAIARLKATKADLQKSIGKLSISTTVDGKKALADALRFKTQLDTALKNAGEVNIDVRTDRALAQMAAFDAKAAVLSDKAGNDSGSKFGAGFAKAAKKAQDAAPWWTSLAAAVPVVSSIAGAVVAASVGLAGLAAAGGIAAGVFTSVAIPVLSKASTAASAVAAAQAAYNAAIASGTNPAAAYATEQKAISAAYAGMSPQQITLSKQLGSISSGWAGIEKASAPVISGALQPWLASVTKLMTFVQPIIADTAPVVKDLGDSFLSLVNSKFFEKFATWAGQVGSKALLAAGNGLIGFVSGIVKLLPLFTPLISDAGSALSGWGAAFSKWAGSSSARADVQKFMQWFHDNGRLVGSLLTNAGAALKALSPGFGPAATGELKVVSDFFAFIAKLPPSIAKPLTDVSLVLLTLNKLGVVSVGFKIIGAAAGWVKSLLGGATVDIGAAGMQTAGDTMVTAAGLMQTAADTMVGADAAAGAELGGGAAVALEGAAPAIGTMIGLAIVAELGTALILKQFSNWFNTGVKGATGGNLAPNSSPDFNKNGQPITPAAKAQIKAADTAPPASSFALSGSAAIIEMGNFNDTVRQQAAYLKLTTADINTYTDAIQKYGANSPQAQQAAEKLTKDQETQGASAKTAGANTSAYGAAVVAAGSKMNGAQQAATTYSDALAAAHGKTTDLTISTADGLYNALIKSGDSSTTAKGQIEAMAEQQGLSKAQADLLASSLTNQSNKSIDLTKSQQTLTSVLGTMESQGKLTSAQTDDLSSAIVTNKGHVDDSKASFDKFAGSIGISTGKANDLWSKLKNVAGTYKANVDVNVSGGGSVSASVKILNGVGVLNPTTPAAVASVNAQAKAKSEITLPGKAAGGIIPGGIHGVDSVHAMLAPGELVIPSTHAAMFAPQAKAAGIPGFAAGGYLTPSASFAQAGSVGSSLNAVAEPGFATKIGNQTATAVASALTSGLISGQQAALAAQAAAMGGPNGGPLGPAGAGEIANGESIFKYLIANAHMTPIAAAGAIASIWGESTWNPMAQGTGGRGLIGWTPPSTISNAAFSGGLSTQLPQVIRFISTSGDWGVINEMNNSDSVLAAANLWGKGVERYGINDVHSEGIALATSILNGYKAGNSSASGTQSLSNAIGKASQKPHSTGGVISEPVFGYGKNSGMAYSFAENGQPEYVSNAGQHAAASNTGMPGATNVGQQTLIQQNASIIKLLQQQPAAMRQAIGGAAGIGVHHGYYGAGG